MQYYLKTNTEQEMRSLLRAAGFEDEEGTQLGIDIDHIGSIQWADGTIDEHWHTNINVLGELPQEKQAMLPILNPPPANPWRVFC